MENKKFIFLSINRYERKKDLKLAIKALASLRDKLKENQSDKELWNSCHLILAGGYDKRLGENINHFGELKELAKSLNPLTNLESAGMGQSESRSSLKSSSKKG